MKKLVLCIAFLGLFTYMAGAQQQSNEIATKSPDNIYIGAVLDGTKINEDEHTTFPIITSDLTIVLDGVNARSQTIAPTREAMYQAVEAALQSVDYGGGQNNRFSFHIQELQSYADLHIPFGQTINLEKWLAIDEGQRLPRTLMAIDIKRHAFSLTMDIDDFETDADELAKHDEEQLIYAQSISFGRRALVVVESDAEGSALTAAVQEALGNGAPTEQQEALIANATFRVLWFGDAAIAVAPDAPLEGIVDYIAAPFSSEDYGKPVSFGAAYLKNNGAFVNEY